MSHINYDAPCKLGPLNNNSTELPSLQNGALNLVGSLCYLSIGSMHVKYMNGQSEGIRLTLGDTFFRLNVANAVLAILNGLVFLVDASYCIVQVIND